MTYGRDFCKYNNQKRLFVRGGAEDSVTDTWERVCETPCRGPTSRSERMPRSRGEPPTRFRDLQGSSLLRHAQPQPPVNLHAHIASTVGHFPLRPACHSRVTTRMAPRDRSPSLLGQPKVHTTWETIALLPFRLTSYINSSARLIISSADAGAVVNVTTPTLNETGHSRCRTALSKLACTFSMTKEALSASVSGKRIANSSPPRRAAVSVSRRVASKPFPMVFKSSSPTACPNPSFTCLKLSTSM